MIYRPIVEFKSEEQRDGSRLEGLVPHKYLFIKLLSQPGGRSPLFQRRVLRYPGSAFAHCQAFAHFQIGFYQLNAILVQISYLSLPPLRIMATFLRSSLLLLALVEAQPRLWIPNPYSPLLYGFGIISKAEIDFPFLLCTVFRVAFALADFPRLGDTTRFTYK